MLWTGNGLSLQDLFTFQTRLVEFGQAGEVGIRIGGQIDKTLQKRQKRNA